MKKFIRSAPPAPPKNYSSSPLAATAAPLLLLPLIAATAHAAATIAPIPTLGGSTDYAWAINDNGTVVGDATQTNSTLRVPYVWNASTGTVPLGRVSSYGGYAYGISNTGLIAGEDDNLSLNGDAVQWNGSTSPTILNSPGNISAFASSINTNGVAVGGYFDGGAVNHTHAARWNADGSFLDLGTLSSDVSSSAAAINDSGTIVGYSQSASGNPTAFIYAPASGMQKISVPGVNLFYAQAINNAGTVVGGGSTGAYQWSPTSGFLSLGGALGGTAEGINDAGLIVGYGYSGPNQTAWLWSDGSLGFSGVRNLNSFLSPADAARWTLEDAVDINNLNQIVGYGLYDDDNNPATPAVTRAFILSIPEPTTLPLLALAALPLLLKRKPSHRESPRNDIANPPATRPPQKCLAASQRNAFPAPRPNGANVCSHGCSNAQPVETKSSHPPLAPTGAKEPPPHPANPKSHG